jgi:hypothetical protein
MKPADVARGEAGGLTAAATVRRMEGSILLDCWEIVQRQDTWLWTTLSGFESLSPSHRAALGRAPV